MNYYKYIFLFLSFSLFAQEKIYTKSISSIALEDCNLIQVDKFGTQYSFKNNTLYSEGNKGKFEYSNVQLGNIESISAFNPLKTNVFYKDFNTVIILDNRLSEITKISFNTLKPFRNISHVSTGNDNTVWVFNQDTQELELFDFRTNLTKAKTLPISGNIIQIASNYNTCWVLTNKHLYVYNYFGSLLKKMVNDGFSSLIESDGNIVLKKDNMLFYLVNNTANTIPIILPNLLIKQFFVTNETLYICDGEMLHQYQLIKD